MADGNYILKFDADISGVNRAIESLGATAQGVFTRIQTAQAAAVSGPAAIAATGQVNLPTATAASAGGRALIPGSRNLFGENALQNFRDLQQQLAQLPAFFPSAGQQFLGQTVGDELGGLPTRTASGGLTPAVRSLLETRIQQIVSESGAVLGPRGGALRGEQLVNAQNDARSFLTDQILREANEVSRATRLEATTRQRSDQLSTRVAELKSEEIRESERGLAKTRELTRIDDRLAVLDDPSLEDPRRQVGIRNELDRQQQQIVNARDPLIQAAEDEVAQLRRDKQGRQKLQALQDPLTQAINDEVAGINAGNRTRQRLQQLQDPILTAQRRQLDIAAEKDRLDKERTLIADDTLSLERDANAIIKKEDALRRQRVVASDDGVRAESEALAIQQKLNSENDRKAVLADDSIRLIQQENKNTQRLQSLDSRRRALLGVQTDVDSRNVQEAEQRLNDVKSQRSIDQAVRNRQTALLGRQAILLDASVEQQEIQNARLRAAQEVRINAAAAVARADAQRAQDAQSESLLIRARARGGFVGGFAGQIARGPVAGQAGGFGSFLGAGAASTLRFALPGAALFGFARGITETVREAEELQQILVRLESQFESLGRRGVFGNTVDETIAAKNALDEYTQALFQVSRDTGIATDATVELGQRFIGLFSSIGDSTEVVGLSEAAVRATSEFAVITGLPLEETFNDLAGGVRSFGETSVEISDLILQFTDLTVAVSDATGVATGEIADFVGRLGPAAAQAGLEFEELFALGATALQGSGVGGAALAEQFNRILTGLQGELGTELGRLSIQFADVFAGIQLDDGRTVADLFNLQTIAAGEVDEVLIGLIQGFDSLSQAQQRQIIASIGSRREGATLATVLQNAATFTNALEATTDAAGERQERFAEIIDRLTGQLARLRVELVQLGLDIFNAGLEDVLSGILDALGLVIDAFQLLGSVLGFVVDIFSFLPDGFNQSLIALLSLTAAAKALIAVLALAGSNIGFLNTVSNAVAGTALYMSDAFKAAGGGLRGLAAGAGVAATSLRALAVSFAPLAVITAAVLAYNEFRNAVNEANEAAAENRERIADLAPGLAEQGDLFDQAAQRARNYASALSEVNEQEDRLSGPTTGPLGRSFDEGLSQIEDADLRSRTRAAFADFAPSDLDDFGQRLASRQSDVAAVARTLRDLRENEDEGIIPEFLGRSQGPGLFRAQLEDLINQTEVPPEVRELGQAVLDGELNIEEAVELITVFYNTATAENERIKNAGQEAKDALERAFLAGDEDVVRRFQDDLGNLAAITDSRLLSELALELLQLPPEAVRAQEADLARQTIGLAREQFQAGVISQREFLEVAREEIGDLRRIVQSNIQAGNTGEAAIATAKELRELEEEIAKSVVERAEADRDFLELIGSPLEGQELAQSLIDLANTSDVQADSAQFAALVGDIIRAEQQIALDLIEGAESAEEQLAIRDAFGLSEAASRLVTLSQIQLNEDVLEVIAAAKIAAEELPAFFNDLATGVEEGVALGDLLIEVILLEIERLTSLLLTADSGARAGLSERIQELNVLVREVASASVITGADVGLGLEEDLDARIIQERIEGFIEQAERQADILNSLGQSDAAAAERIRGLVAALRDPEFSSSGLDREELLIQLNDEINEVLEQEGEKSQAFLDAINQVVDGTNLTVQEFASIGLIQSLGDQSQVAFVSLVNGYIAANTALSNSLINETRAAAEVYEFGVDEARSIFKAALERLQALLIDIVTNTDLFGGASFGVEAVGVFNSIQRLNELINDPRLGPAVDSLKNFTFNAAGGGGGDTLGDLLEAERALARALVSNNPEELARLELAIADEELAAAENRVEELQALTQQVEARRNLEQVLNDVFNAETQLAIAVLESQGDVAGALALGVAAAEQNLAFLQNVGAGAAEIAAAELAVLNAQNAQQDGLVQAQLDELGFLFNIGDLSTQAYITALQEILNQLDPVADVDLWRRISLQIKGLKESSNELQFNLPDSFDLPTLYEVRRLNQGSFDGTDALQLGTSTTDNRQYSIEINVQTGMDWEDARDILADALGADTNVFSLGTRRY